MSKIIFSETRTGMSKGVLDIDLMKSFVDDLVDEVVEVSPGLEQKP